MAVQVCLVGLNHKDIFALTTFKIILYEFKHFISQTLRHLRSDRVDRNAIVYHLIWPRGPAGIAYNNRP